MAPRCLSRQRQRTHLDDVVDGVFASAFDMPSADALAIEVRAPVDYDVSAGSARDAATVGMSLSRSASSRGYLLVWARSTAMRPSTPFRWITAENSERWVITMLTPSTMRSMIR